MKYIHLTQEFKIKELGKLKYFLGIEVAYSKKDIFIFQRKIYTRSTKKDRES